MISIWRKENTGEAGCSVVENVQAEIDGSPLGCGSGAVERSGLL